MTPQIEHGIKGMLKKTTKGVLMTETQLIIDGFSVHVPNEYRNEVLGVFNGLGLDALDLDGRSGDDTEREIAAGSIDGDNPQDLENFCRVLDTLDYMTVPYHAEVLAAGVLREVLDYMASRGRTEIQPTYTTVGGMRTHDGGFTAGDFEASTSY